MLRHKEGKVRGYRVREGDGRLHRSIAPHGESQKVLREIVRQRTLNVKRKSREKVFAEHLNKKG